MGHIVSNEFNAGHHTDSTMDSETFSGYVSPPQFESWVLTKTCNFLWFPKDVGHCRPSFEVRGLSLILGHLQVLGPMPAQIENLLGNESLDASLFAQLWFYLPRFSCILHHGGSDPHLGYLLPQLLDEEVRRLFYFSSWGFEHHHKAAHISQGSCCAFIAVYLCTPLMQVFRFRLTIGPMA